MLLLRKCGLMARTAKTTTINTAITAITQMITTADESTPSEVPSASELAEGEAVGGATVVVAGSIGTSMVDTTAVAALLTVFDFGSPFTV